MRSAGCLALCPGRHSLAVALQILGRGLTGNKPSMQRSRFQMMPHPHGIASPVPSMATSRQRTTMSRCKLLWQIGLLGPLVSCLVAWLYLKSPYEPKDATSVAKAFVSEATQGNWRLAHELTLKNEYTDRTPDELRQAWKQQHCGKVSMVSWGPPQSHGNRLRQWKVFNFQSHAG